MQGGKKYVLTYVLTYIQDTYAWIKSIQAKCQMKKMHTANEYTLDGEIHSQDLVNVSSANLKIE